MQSIRYQFNWNNMIQRLLPGTCTAIALSIIHHATAIAMPLARNNFIWKGHHSSVINICQLKSMQISVHLKELPRKLHNYLNAISQTTRATFLVWYLIYYYSLHQYLNYKGFKRFNIWFAVKRTDSRDRNLLSPFISIQLT